MKTADGLGKRRRRRRVLKRRGLCSRLARRIKGNPVRLCLVLIIGIQIILLLVLSSLDIPSSSPPIGGIFKRNVRDEAVHSVQSVLQGLRGYDIGIGERFSAQQSEPISPHGWRCTQPEAQISRKFFGDGAPQHNGYIYIILGDHVFSPKASKQQLIISGRDSAMFDVLMGGSEERGAFEVEKAAGESVLVYDSDDIFTTSTGMGAPTWLVLYKNEQANVLVHLAVKEEFDGRGDKQQLLLPATACPKGVDSSDESEYRKLTESFRLLSQKFNEPQRRPFFRRRTGKDASPGLVTLCTQMTVDRLPRLLAQATNFAGPISAVVFVGRYKSAEEEIKEVETAWESSEVMQQYVDIHLVIDGGKPWFISAATDEGHGRNPYPINLLRQESINRAETKWVFVVEGDIIPAPRAHDVIRSVWEDMLREEKRLLEANHSPPGVAFVVLLYHASSKDPNAFFDWFSSPLSKRVPKNKEDLVASVAKGDVMRMSDVYASHSGFDYPSWEARRDSAFAPYTWVSGAEPYHISRKDKVPPFDPLFAGMTNDKTSQLEDMGEAGFHFAVHPFLYAVNFDSDGIGESWIPLSQQSYWRDDFVNFMHTIDFNDYKRRINNPS